MHPIICRIGPLTIYSYGVMLALAVLICTFLLRLEAKRVHLPSEDIVDLVFWLVIGGIIGCRIFFIFLNFSYFFNHPSEILMVQKGGLAWQGGLIFGTLTGLIFIKKKKLPALKVLDTIAPYVALGQAIGRIGCFLNGCCYGKHVAWGVYFPIHQDTLHPTQLYSTLGLSLVFLILKKYQKKERVPGQVFILYLAGTSVLRFIIEFFRGDHTPVFLDLSVFQIVTLIIFGFAIYANAYLTSRSRR